MKVERETYDDMRNLLIAYVGKDKLNSISKAVRRVVDEVDTTRCWYSRFYIDKKTKQKIFNKKDLAGVKKFRTIESPAGELKLACKTINKLMLPLTSGKYWVKGFNSQENVMKNAQYHQRNGAKYAINIDLENAFGQINTKNLKMFGRYVMCWNKRTSKKFAMMMTKNGCMVQGNPLSPLLLNLFCDVLDAVILGFVKENQIFYTRYADDLTFSSRNPITNLQYHLILDIIKHFGFKVNKEKTKFTKNLVEITGIFIRGKKYIKTSRRKHKNNIRALRFIEKKYNTPFVKRKSKNGQPIEIARIIEGVENWLHMFDPVYKVKKQLEIKQRRAEKSKRKRQLKLSNQLNN